MDIGVALGFIGIGLSIILTVVSIMDKTRPNLYITLLLIVFFINSLVFSNSYYAMLIPVFLMLIYLLLLKFKPTDFTIQKAYSAKPLMKKLFSVMQEQGLTALPTFKLIAKTFNEKGKLVGISDEEMIEMLIEHATIWKSKNDNSGAFFSAMANLTIANISASNQIEKGKKYIKDKYIEIMNSEKEELPSIITNTIQSSNEIVETGQPDYERYN